MKKSKAIILTSLLGGSLGVAATLLVPAKAVGGCMLDDIVSGYTCSDCELDWADGYFCDGLLGGVCYTEDDRNTCFG
jgi:hypothetical protein